MKKYSGGPGSPDAVEDPVKLAFYEKVSLIAKADLHSAKSRSKVLTYE